MTLYLLPGGVEVPVAPQLLHHLVLLGAELGRVNLGELLESETPLVEAGSEGYGTLVGVHLFFQGTIRRIFSQEPDETCRIS